MKKWIALFPLLAGLVFALTSCGTTPGGIETPTPLPVVETMQPLTGRLEAEIRYTGGWYRETFDYRPDAPNIRHLLLVMPVESDIALESPGWVFTSLEFTPYPEPLTVRMGLVEYIPLLEYLYDAPQGDATLDLPPGAYNLAAAFLAAPLPPPGDDALLYPGVTGGGASTEFQQVVIAAGETIEILIELTDEDGWG
ncbi:MAG: hypothetical protein ACOYYJ_09580 [Chloroflexota bacterium]